MAVARKECLTPFRKNEVRVMRIALAAAPVKNQNVVFNTSSMINQIHRASGKADVILFGESVLQGFDCLVWDYEIDRHMALDIKDAPILQLRKPQEKAKSRYPLALLNVLMICCTAVRFLLALMVKS